MKHTWLALTLCLLLTATSAWAAGGVPLAPAVDGSTALTAIHAQHAESAIEVKACRIINIKLGRVGGHSEAKRVHDVCKANSVPVWCGGMLEAGIGRAHNIAMSTLPGFTLPGDVSASARYWDEDIIEPEVEVTKRGTILVPQVPGLGYAVRRDRVEKLTVRKKEWKSTMQSVGFSS